MKKCKYCGILPVPVKSELYAFGFECPNGCEHKLEALAHNKETAIARWEFLNTDQYGQQIFEQTVQWIEWDGILEHLPKADELYIRKEGDTQIHTGLRYPAFKDSAYITGYGYLSLEKGDHVAEKCCNKLVAVEERNGQV